MGLFSGIKKVANKAFDIGKDVVSSGTGGDWLGLGTAVLGGLASQQGDATSSQINRRALSDAERAYLQRLDQGVGSLGQLYNDPSQWPEFAPKPYSPANPYEQAGIGGYGGYATQAVPGLYGAGEDAFLSNLSGNTPLGGYANQLQNILPTLTGALGTPPQVTNPGYDPSQYLGLTQGMGVDPTQGIESLLSGNLDTGLFQGAIDQYLQPAMEQFNEQLLPSFLRADQAATGGQSSAGALKASQRTQEQIGEGLGAYLGGRLYDASQAAANRVGQGVQGALSQQGQNQAGIGLSGQFGQIGSQFDLNSQLANQGAYSDWTRNLLGGTGLGIGAAADQATTQARFGSLLPSLGQFALSAPDALTQAGSLQRGIDDRDAGYNSQQFAYNQQLPFMMGNDWLSALRGSAISNPANAQLQQPDTSNSTFGQIIGGLSAGLGSYYPQNPMMQPGVQSPAPQQMAGTPLPGYQPPSNMYGMGLPSGTMAPTLMTNNPGYGSIIEQLWGNYG